MMRFYQALFSTIAHLGLGWYMQSDWALVLTCITETFLTFVVSKLRHYRLSIDRHATREIFG